MSGYVFGFLWHVFLGGPVDLMIFFWQKMGTKKISTDIMTHQARIDKNNDMFGYFWKLQLYQLEFGAVWCFFVGGLWWPRFCWPPSF